MRGYAIVKHGDARLKFQAQQAFHLGWRIEAMKC
jgi:hypothetical protein